jgi:hypothetical protein
MPILGIMASQISGKLWQPDGAYDSLATVTVGSGGAASVTFAGIPNTYKHLQIRALLKTTTATGGSSSTGVTVNGNAMARYHYLYGDGSTVLAGSVAGSGVNNTANANLTSIFSVMILDVLDYANTSKNKTFRALGGYDANGSGELALYSNLYLNNTDAITSLQFSLSAGSYAQYSQFTLYGVK